MRARSALTGVWAFFLTSLFCSFLYADSGEKIKIKDSLFSVDFVDGNNGWAVGYYGKILHTGDGGSTWAPQESGTKKPLASVDFVDPLYGWAVGYGPTILHTSDGGKTWVTQKTEEEIFYLTAVRFIDQQRGWAVGDWGTIIHTNDGGTTWQPQLTGDDAVLYAIDFADDRNGWAVGEFGTIVHTADGGATWDKQASNVENVFFSCHALDLENVWVAGIDSIALRTRDGGLTWENVDTGIRKVLPFYSVNFPDHRNGVICGQGFVMYTEDGGVSWRHGAVDGAIQYIWLHGVSSTSEAVWMVGEHGKIFKSGNGGKDWKQTVY